ncbi:uncharacterized protein LOC112341114 [Selaginella moellendorffii]|uniref:uncharacterized protein LOC112341114 n=1 Tax=Selaginella moellendorffii TaxID=88036 RepID=UPI000D1C6428|nr:uncharacterized protein LOC112341114 [Selaginella moellendorffii]|eukprot:XP_024516402.1 uncharacterized protein LOC112341114 [Selaginella moellendorffii]
MGTDLVLEVHWGACAVESPWRRVTHEQRRVIVLELDRFGCDDVELDRHGVRLACHHCDRVEEWQGEAGGFKLCGGVTWEADGPRAAPGVRAHSFTSLFESALSMLF